MDYSNIFLCKKIGENYSAVRADGYAHGIRRCEFRVELVIHVIETESRLFESLNEGLY